MDHDDKKRQRFPAAVIVLLYSLIVSPGLFAEIQTDGTMGPAQALSGPDYTITHTLGTTTGTNLFHSFDTFSISQGESATFTGPDAIRNVISRVTGGEISTINGLLRSQVGQADFLFINPAGVVFGEHAAVDVPAAFHVSTADEIRFSDGTTFSAAAPYDNSLTSVSPEAFGFLDGAQTAGIRINGSKLEFAPESTVSLSGGDITIQGGQENSDDGGGEHRAALTCEQGEIQLAAMGDNSGAVSLDGTAYTDAGGNLEVNASALDVSGHGGGKIAIQAGNIQIRGGSVLASDNTGDIHTDAHDGIQIQSSGTLEILEGSRIQSNVFSSGDGGAIEVKAENMLILQQEGEAFTGIFMEVESEATGNGTVMDIQVEEKLTLQGAAGLLNTTYGYGDAASVNVKVGDLLMDGEGRSVPYRNSSFIAGISSDAMLGSEGDAGNITLSASDLVELINGGVITANTLSIGNAGDIILHAGSLKMDKQASITNEAGSVQVHQTGDAGNITLSASDLVELINERIITGNTLSIDNAEDIIFNDGNFQMDELASIINEAESVQINQTGHAGNIDMTIDNRLEILAGSKISTATSSSGHEEANAIHIQAEEIVIKGENWEKGSGILSTTVGGNNAGNVFVTAENNLDITYALISSDTMGSGNGGTITVNAGETLNLLTSSFVSSSSYFFSGNAGTVFIQSKDIITEDLSGIASMTMGKGNAGSVIINAEELSVSKHGFISSRAQEGYTGFSGGYAGDVIVNADRIILSGGSIIDISSSQIFGDIPSDTPDAMIQVNAGQLHLGQDARITSESTGNVPAGAIEVNSDHFLVENGSKITTSAEQADGGPINIHGNTLMLRDGQITTSVTGDAGDGGNIEISGREGNPAAVLVLDGGFIQANTVADHAKGGEILINTKTVITRFGEAPEVGGNVPQEYIAGNGRNIIQAAAPGGEKGDIEITAPDLDISSTLIQTVANFKAPIQLATDPCTVEGGQGRNSLILKDKKYIPPGPLDTAGFRWNENRIHRLTQKKER